MAQTDQISIYRLDASRLANKASSEVFSYILEEYFRKEKIKKQKNKRYQPREYTRISDGLYKGTEVGIYISRNLHPHKWQNFFELVTASDELKKLTVQNWNVLVLLPVRGNLYAFTSGSAHNVVKDFVDENFPIEVAKRLLDPAEIKQTKERLLIGSIYARDRHFRRKYKISASEAFGRVWKLITGSLRQESLEAFGLNDLFRGQEEVNCEVKSSFKINKRVAFSELYELIVTLDEVSSTEMTSDQETAFAFLTSIRPISTKNPIYRELWEELTRVAFEAYTAVSPLFDFDFCNVEYDKYLAADEITIKYGGKKIEVEPYSDGTAIIKKLKQITNWSAINEFAEGISRVVVDALNREAPTNGTSGAFIDHLHGEIELKGKSYFLIDGNWYAVDDGFLNRLESDFRSLLAEDGRVLLSTDGLLMKWEPGFDEGSFNEAHKDKEGYIVCDRILPFGIEPCDILIIGDSQLYLVHNKIGLGASTRDACSQIINSARTLLESVKSDQVFIKEYYRLITEYPGTDPYRAIAKKKVVDMGEESFKALFNNKMTFVLGFYDDAKTERILSEDTTKEFPSNIARFEILNLVENLNGLGVAFKILQIRRA